MRRDKAPQRRTHHTAAAATTTWDLSSPSSAFLEQDTVDGGEWETALGTYDEPWEDQSWEEPEEAEVLDDDWTDELPPEDPELEDQFGSLEAAEAYTATYTSDNADHRELYEVDKGFSLINSLQHFESFDEGHIFRQCTQCPSPSVGVFAEWAAFGVEDVKGYALLDTGASRSVGGYMMVQYVTDCLSCNTAPPWLESADPAVSFTFAGGEKAHSETRIWLPLPGTRHERFAVHIVPSEVTPILLGLDMLREFGLVINTDSSHCYSTKLRCRIPVTVLPSGHLALALTPSGSFETTGETTTLVEETAADTTAAVQEDLLE